MEMKAPDRGERENDSDHAIRMINSAMDRLVEGSMDGKDVLIKSESRLHLPNERVMSICIKSTSLWIL